MKTFIWAFSFLIVCLACNQSAHPNNKATNAAGSQTSNAKGVQQQQAPPTLSDLSYLQLTRTINVAPNSSMGVGFEEFP